MRYKVYLAKLKRAMRIKGLPYTVYKVGKTASADALRRLTFTGPSELNPIVSVFPDVKVMHSVWCETEEEADYLEQHLMNTIKRNEARFHNWYEPRQISGITEMRKWNYDEVQEIFRLMNEYKDKNNENCA